MDVRQTIFKNDVQKMSAAEMLDYLSKELNRQNEEGEMVIDESEIKSAVGQKPEDEIPIYPYAISEDTDTGEVEILPMGDEKHFILHGAKEALWFTALLLKYYSR